MIQVRCDNYHIEVEKECFFSIITPNYNSGDKLVRAIKSITNNAVSFEHIIVDDCSTDESFILAQQLGISISSFNIIFLSNLSNSGPAISRNKGLDVAKGKYILFLDADDYFIECTLDILYNAIKSNNMPDVLTYNYQMIESTNEIIALTKDSNIANVICNPIKEYLSDKIISAPWGKCIEADLAKSFRFPDLIVSEDALYNLDIFINAKSVFKIDSTLYIFDKTDSNSLTRKAFDRKEFMKFHNGWVAFEKKALKEIQLKNSHRLLASRKIRFEVLYYINRMIVSPDSKVDKFIIGSIKETIHNNIILARNELSAKVKILCFMFYFFPSLTISLVKFYKVF
ncbi:glycosyltransferase family 2 protein [Psychrobacter sp. NG254]|uniref:glycosyltransferase family 2 protein n=1 Tax=Psychrobacter sp. NG254 TaxID=2782003 RepID=UPI00188746BD|nr:glycosyltransferase family 2 protein [Psychrobacter sp. NG254]MBF2719724.1 glycosyltransferase family 2 protein [Psychrobacter sp. NG254]